VRSRRSARPTVMAGRGAGISSCRVSLERGDGDGRADRALSWRERRGRGGRGRGERYMGRVRVRAALRPSKSSK
jgi:hypothetical protein